MSYGELFSRLMFQAIKREETEMKRLKEEARNPKQTRDTVREYPEMWLWPTFLKEAMEDPDCPKLAWDRGNVDCTFMEGDKTVARFELKTFSPLDVDKDAQWFDAILEDFEKQLGRAKLAPGIEHYVVLLPYGQPAAIDSWISGVLLPRVSEEYRGIRVRRIPAEGSIELNRKDDGCAAVSVFRVASD
jgi:hypothetical protein